jgi:hypothetical protein
MRLKGCPETSIEITAIRRVETQTSEVLKQQVCVLLTLLRHHEKSYVGVNFDPIKKNKIKSQFITILYGCETWSLTLREERRHFHKLYTSY